MCRICDKECKGVYCSKECYNIYRASLLVEVTCQKCGVSFRKPKRLIERSQLNFCSRGCNTRYYNVIKNLTLMTEEVKEKLSRVRYGTGEGKSYLKLKGRHVHRQVMEDILGRPLEKDEVVHHIDGDKRNNSPENLELMRNQAEHARSHKKKRGDANV